MDDLFGRFCSVMAALTWACALIFFKKSGERIPPLALNLFKNILGLVLLFGTLGYLELVEPGEWSAVRNYPREDLYILVFSGVIGIALADTLFFHSLNLIGVGMFAIVDCFYSPMVIGTAWLLLSEHLTLSHYVGGALILLGIFVSSGHAPPPNRTRGQIILGVILGMLALGSMAIGIVLAKPVLEVDGYPVFWATTIRMLFGTAALLVMILASPQRRALLAPLKPTSFWKYSVPGSILGGYLSMVFWLAGFKFTNASIAAILNQTSTLFAIILAWVFLKDKLTPRKIASAIVAISGLMIVMTNALDGLIQ